MKYKIHKQSTNMIVYDLLDDSNNVVFANGVHEDKITDIGSLMKDIIIPAYLAPVEDTTEELMTVKEVEILLVDKGYITESETLADLKTKADLITTESIKETKD